jgi:outer membrane lipoprotein-sorting protein
LLREEALDLPAARQAGGKPCYVVESIPKSRASFTRKLAWMDGTSFLPLKEEYYDAQKELFKVFTADEVRDVDRVPTITKRTMKNVKSGHRTEVVFKQVKYNVGLAEDVFTERSLRRPPAQWVSTD